MSEYRLAAVARNVVVPGQASDGTRIDLEDVDSGLGRLRAAPPVRGGDGLLFETGDVLFAKLRPYLRKSLRVDKPGACSPEFLVLRPGADLESRYLGYVVQGDAFVDAAVSTTDGAKMPRTSFEKLRGTRIVVPRRDAQAAIADFLDAETAQIDALISSRNRQRQLMLERQTALRATTLARAGGTAMALVRTVRDSIGGVWGNEPDGSREDRRVVRVADFDYRALATRADVETIRSIPNSQFNQRSLEQGDLLLEKSGGGEKQNVGRVVSVASGLRGATYSNFIARVRAGPGMDSRFLVHLHAVLYARGVAAANTKQTTGIQNLDVGAYLHTSVRIPSLEVQRRVGAELDAALECGNELTIAIDRQIALLRERRQALITAAVAGELQVSSAAAAKTAA